MAFAASSPERTPGALSGFGAIQRIQKGRAGHEPPASERPRPAMCGRCAVDARSRCARCVLQDRPDSPVLRVGAVEDMPPAQRPTMVRGFVSLTPLPPAKASHERASLCTRSAPAESRWISRVHIPDMGSRSPSCSSPPPPPCRHGSTPSWRIQAAPCRRSVPRCRCRACGSSRARSCRCPHGSQRLRARPARRSPVDAQSIGIGGECVHSAFTRDGDRRGDGASRWQPGGVGFGGRSSSGADRGARSSWGRRSKRRTGRWRRKIRTLGRWPRLTQWRTALSGRARHRFGRLGAWPIRIRLSFQPGRSWSAR